MWTNAFLASLIPAVSATNLLLPLYAYPANWQGAWDNVYAAIAANPDVDFQIILNPSNGPGGSNPGYNSDWIPAVAKLNSFPNVQTFGYVHTSYGARAVSDVEADIADWALWNTYTQSDISVHGIFFDETPAGWASDGGPNDVAYMRELTDNCYDQFDGDDSFQTIYNLGTATNHPEYFDGTMADYVIVGEYSASFYSSNPRLLSSNTPKGREDMTSWLIYDFAGANLGSKTVRDWLKAFVKAGVGSVNVVDYGWDRANTADAPADIGSVAALLSSLQS